MKRVVEVQLKDADPLTVTYDRDALIRATAEGMPTAILGGKWAETGTTVDTLADAIVSWDLIEDDGRAYPISRESLSQLPLWVIFKIDRAIWADAFEGD
jgi:hypothetical protein